MRLINVKSMELEEFFDESIPRYAILSHTWTTDEVLYKDFQEDELDTSNPRSAKIVGCCTQAALDGQQYVWIDTCCIDKSSSAELSEAINSMFAWYSNAQVCYVYLSDVLKGHSQAGSQLRASRWFTRGWTLQELLAPRKLVFFDQAWVVIFILDKDKTLWLKSKDTSAFARVLSRLTGIPWPNLLDMEAESPSVAKKMSWAADRRTTRKEDEAYCLLGMFDINLTLLYGEGSKAFVRLQEEIMRTSDDHTLFGWGYETRPPLLHLYKPSIKVGSSLLAESPLAFRGCGELIRLGPIGESPEASDYSMTNKGIHITLRCGQFSSTLLNAILVLFDCTTVEGYAKSGVMALLLCRNTRAVGGGALYHRDHSTMPVLISKNILPSQDRLPIYVTQCPNDLEFEHIGTYLAIGPFLSGFDLVESYPPGTLAMIANPGRRDRSYCLKLSISRAMRPEHSVILLMFTNRSGQGFLLALDLGEDDTVSSQTLQVGRVALKDCGAASRSIVESEAESFRKMTVVKDETAGFGPGRTVDLQAVRIHNTNASRSNAFDQRPEAVFVWERQSASITFWERSLTVRLDSDGWRIALDFDDAEDRWNL